MTNQNHTDEYSAFLADKTDLGDGHGFEPIEIPSFLKPFQASLDEWAIRQGRAAILADCGLGKTPMLYTWSDNVVRHTNGRVLVIAPLGVVGQEIREANKFGFDAEASRDGRFSKRIVVTNYEKLHLFKPSDFDGVVCDEASILKNCDGKTRDAIIEFLRTIKYRLLCTATAAPNDYEELGNHAEALGEMGYQDMITKFFKQDLVKRGGQGWGRPKYRMRAHGERDFWRWICSWARACRRPSDLGFDNDGYVLPELITNEHVIVARKRKPGFLFDMPANGLIEEKEERRRTITERCEKVAELLDHGKQAIAWCHLNPEGDLLQKLIKDSIQISGKDSDESKERKILGFTNGDYRVLVTKPVLCGFGLNLQFCAHNAVFPSHSFEQYYQLVRRTWRFGQLETVIVDTVTSEGEQGVMKNRQRKSNAADVMFSRLVELMNAELRIDRRKPFVKQEEIPIWMHQANPH